MGKWIGLPKPQTKNFFWITSGYKDDNSVYQEYYIMILVINYLNISDEKPFKDEIESNSSQPQIEFFRK